MEETGGAPESSEKQPLSVTDSDERALFFHRTAVFGERGAE